MIVETITHGYCARVQTDQGARCGNAAVVERLARWVCDFHCWLVADGCAGGGADASENKRLSPGRRSATAARKSRYDTRRTVEA